MRPIVDSHLDLAANVLAGRDLTLDAQTIRDREQRTEKQCMVSLPELRRGGVALAFGSIYSAPTYDDSGEPIFDPKVAAGGRRQLEVYQGWEEAGLARIIRGRRSLEEHLGLWQTDGLTGILIAMESAEPLESAEDLASWYDGGVRSIGPAWMYTRYCGGFAGANGRPTGLTSMGHELVAAMAQRDVILDLAHMSIESMYESLDTKHPNIVLTHTAPRELTGIQRLPDAAMFAAIAGRGGMVGLGLGNAFLADDWWSGGARQSKVTLDQHGRRAFSLVAGSTGWDGLGVGSDLDGGFGVDESPVELGSEADLGKLADVLPSEHADGVLGGNWLNFLRRALPDD